MDRPTDTAAPQGRATRGMRDVRADRRWIRARGQRGVVLDQDRWRAAYGDPRYGETLRWRRYDVPQHLAPETSDALRFCAVEGDLDLLDRRHRSTIEAGLSSSPQGRP